MPPSTNTRSTSFHILPRETSGDGELLPSLHDEKILPPPVTPSRRRRRNRSRKRNFSQPSIDVGGFGLGAHVLEERMADGTRSAVSTPGGLMGSVVEHSLRQDSFGSQQSDLIAAASCCSESTPTASSIGSWLVSHSGKELANGNHATPSNGGQELFRRDAQNLCIQACKAYPLNNQNPIHHPIQEDHIMDDNQLSDVFARRLPKQDDKKAEQSETATTVSPVPNGGGYDYLLSPAIHQDLISRSDETYRTSSVKGDLVSPGAMADLQVFVGDGSSALPSQLSRADLRQRLAHNQVDDSSQPGNHHAGELPIESRGFEGSNIANVSEIRESHGAGPSYQTPEKATHVPVRHTETPQLRDWQQLMSANSLGAQPTVASPFEYLLGEIYRRPPVLPETQSAESDKKRQHVYNTMFHVPWRCELLIVIGFFVCMDSFLSLLTVMPVRILVFLSGFVFRRRQFRRLRADELCDLFSLLVLMAGVTLLQQADISYIYHMIRSQATIKLYVVYNVLEIFDKLCQSFGSDVLQVVLNSAENVASCPNTSLVSEMFQFTFDQCIAVVSFVFHSLIILAQSITVSAAIRSHNNALLTLLISNNFAEIKSNVFKRVGRDNLHKLAYLDTVERFHIVAHLFFVLAQNLLAANEPWVQAFACNAGMVFVCEILVDVIKHAFLAKFNEIKPAAYSEFLLALCKQTLSSQSRELHKTMSFAPFAPACVVIRVLIPLYGAYLPGAPLWRLLVMLLFGVVTFVFLVALKILIALGLLKHASWYVDRHQKKEKLLHFD